jgi:peptidoglycan glycosyltransferase
MSLNRIASRSVAILILAAMLVGGLGFFIVEYFVNGGKWVLHAGSPHVYSGPNIGTGIVTDRDGVLLLDMSGNRTYAVTQELRKSMLHWLGDRYGYIQAPALPNYAEEMAGYNSLTGLYSYSGAGQAKLTVSAQIQMAALKALGDRKGTVAVYNYKTGEILCAVSTPTYDPDNVPDIEGDTSGAYEGVYMNRFTQSVYIPGSIFKIVTTAAALEEIPDIREQTFTCTGVYSYGVDSVTCEYKHGTLNFYSAMAQSCNCAYAEIVDQLGAETLSKYVKQYQVTQPVSFDGVTTAAGNFDVANAAPVQVAWSGIGQHKDQINPCRFLTFMGAIANNGVTVEPHLVDRITCGGAVTYKAELGNTERIMSEETAKELQTMMRNNVLEKYGAENFPGLTVCAKSGTGQVGGEQKSNAMFAGFVTDADYPLAFVVAVEDAGYGRHVCVPILSEVLAVCKEVLDAA